MRIRKQYKFESSHIVRKAVSERCSKSFHGHSGIIEVFFRSDHLDRGGMVYDFGAMKAYVGSFLDMFDHSTHLWKDEEPHIIEFFKKENKRWIIVPYNPTAENYALMFKDIINELLEISPYNNGEGKVYCSGVIYHETRTGYAEAEENDTLGVKLTDLIFSPGTYEEVSEELMEYIIEETL